MLNPEYIRGNVDDVKKMLTDRHHSLDDLNRFVELDQIWRSSLAQSESLKEERNKRLPKGKPSESERQILSELSREIKDLDEKVKSLEEERQKVALQLPNRIHETVPLGKSEEDNIEIRRWGTPKTVDFPVLSHDEIGEKLHVLDAESGAKLAGSRFCVLSAFAAQMERALASFMLDTHTQKMDTQKLMRLLS